MKLFHLPLIIFGLLGPLTSCKAENGTSPDNKTETISWVLLGPESSFQVRSVSAGNNCPNLRADSQTIAMKNRQTKPNTSFPVMICEAEVPNPTLQIQVDGVNLPLPNTKPKKIVVLGDTGCRIKEEGTQSFVQACNDPKSWPFAQIAQSAANWKPDLVIHVGDYHYREDNCPVTEPLCQGSITGDRWDSWKQDFFSPALPLLKAAPWIVVRGNHELCSRAGEGWFQLLEPRPAPETCTNKRDPYRIRLENLSLWVMDSADDKNISSSLSKLENTLQPGEWLLSHRPLVTPEVDDESTLDIAPSLPLRLQIPGNLGVVMAGHIHTTMLNQFTDARPPELISGNGGTLLDKPAAVVGSLSTSQKEGYASTVYSDFGYVTLEQKDDTSNWDYIVRDKMGNIVTRCELRQEPHRKTLLLCNPLGNPLGNPLN